MEYLNDRLQEDSDALNHIYVKCRKKRTIPDRTDKQRKQIQERCGLLQKKYKDFCFLMDDESFFTLKHNKIYGNAHYYTSDNKKTPHNVKYNPKKKYEEKILVWVCISNKGVSSPYFLPKNQSMNSFIYLNECIRRRLTSFIQENHSRDRIIFWPDLSTSHYAKIVTQQLNNSRINFVAKEENPPNVPEARPIENFWLHLKALVYKNGWEARNLDQLKRRIKQQLNLVDQQLIKNLMNSIPQRLKKIRRYGVIESI